MTETTWKGELEHLHDLRKIYIRNLQGLYEQKAKTGEFSIRTSNQIDDEKRKLREVEAKILGFEAVYKADWEHDPNLPKPLKPYLTVREKSNDDDEYSDPYRSKSRLLTLLIVVVTIVTFISASLWGFWSLRKTNDQLRSAIPTDDPRVIIIYPGYYHLGDALIRQFHAPYPQSNPFVANFEASQFGENIHLILTASHVDPNFEQSPVKIYMNDAYVTDLNRFFAEEDLGSSDISI